jgi:two-component system nitrogen regulation sensor histidine kinase NtrY
MGLVPFRTSAERKRLIEVVAIVLTTLMLVGISRLETRLFELSEHLARNHDFFTSVIYFGLINLNVVLILVLSFLLFRNMAKLVVERRRGVFGSNLRTKLVVTLMFFALAPTVLFFYISSRFIITSFDEWFSEKVRVTMHQTREAGARVYKQDQRRLESLARIALHRVKVFSPEEQFLLKQQLILPDQLNGFEAQYGLDGVMVYNGDAELIWSSRMQKPAVGDATAPDPFLVDAIGRFRSQPGLFSISTVVGDEQQDIVKGVAPVLQPDTREVVGIVLVETRFETQILKSIESIQKAFSNLRPSAQLIKLSYLVLLVVMTLLVSFSAVWLGFYVAKGITGPIQSLAEGTREVALGNYNITLTARSEDETGQLVKSFNKMTSDLQSHRLRAEEAKVALLHSKEESERRRQYMEVVLKNITAGVIALDSTGVITSVNKAATDLLAVGDNDIVGKHLKQAFDAELYSAMWKPLFEQYLRQPTFSFQTDVRTQGKLLTLLVDGTRIIDDDGEDHGFVVVFDDATERVKAQRVAAWREVARRIAHEIKNPVTPIKLSAQRLLRRFHEKFEGEDREVFESCLETILKQVDSLRDLVNEFSKFSRLPQVRPVLADINEIIMNAVNLYAMSYPLIRIDAGGLCPVPQFLLDPDQMNRVFVNLFSNAVAALDSEPNGLIEVKSKLLKELNTVRIEVSDNGCGIPPALRDRVLEPYFSTKDGGTGLGLAIVNQIISDHGGYLRVEDNLPTGTRIVIELPVRVVQPAQA